MESKESLEKKLAVKEKKVGELRNKISAIKEKTRPKSIMDFVGSFEDACKFKKIKPDSVYNETDTVDEVAYKKIKFTTAVLNEGHIFMMKSNEERWFVWYDISSGSGLVFDFAYYFYGFAFTASASRLCLKSQELAIHAGKILINEYRDFIM